MRTWAKLGLVALSFGLVLMMVGGSNALAQDGKQLFAAKGCVTCHGPQGDKPIMPAYPKLAGQNSEYLVTQLKAFKAQQRKSGQSQLMWGMAAQLSDAEMKKIADWLQSVQ